MKKLYRIVISVLFTSSFIQAQTAVTPQLSDRAASRFLDQATWGPTPAAIAQLEQMGIANWLASQFSLNTSDLPDQPILNSAGKNNRNLQPVQRAFFQNAVTGNDQLRQRIAFALSQIWVVSAVQVTSAYAYPPYWRLFRDNAFGNYRDIIKAVTLNPAMGSYLSMANNNKANPAKGTSPNENYAPGADAALHAGLDAAQYRRVARCSTRITILSRPTRRTTSTITPNCSLGGLTLPLQTRPPGATIPRITSARCSRWKRITTRPGKRCFGTIQVSAGQSAEQDLDSLINALMAQPTMAPFVSQQLIQHLVTSNPSPAYIQRVAQVFQNDGNHVTGNMQAVITAILTDPEARAGDDPNAAVNPAFGHLREPILFMTGLLRGLNATLGATSAVFNDATNMSEDLFNPPSVFSYFSPQYRIQGGLLGPEFQIYSTQTVANRGDTINAALYGALDKGTKVSLAPFVSAASAGTSTLLQYISYVFLHSSMSAALQQQATDAVNAVTTPTQKAQAALYLTLASGEYQVIQ